MNPALGAALLAGGLCVALGALCLRLWRSLGRTEQNLGAARRICDLANDAVLVADIVEGRILHANPAAGELLGQDAAALRGRKLPDLHPRHLVGRSAEIVADVWEKKGLVYSDLPFVRGDGELVDVEVSARVIEYGGGPAILLYARDIRERRRLETQVRAQNAELVRLNQRISDLFGRYVSGEVRDAILAGEGMLGGEEREVSVLFCDLRDFTAMSASTEPQALVAMLNRYFTCMVRAIRDHHGVVDKFIGDAIMAVFGAPWPDESHALNAVAAARAMLRELETFNAEQRARGLPPFRLGVGIAAGKVVAGNLGSEQRMEYTVVGDTVNLASRIEALTKTLGVPVLMNDEAARMAGGHQRLREFPDVAVRGLKKTLSLFAPEADARPA
jgi:PAS domain S-box-containing protein